jgi:hypothetical protein
VQANLALAAGLPIFVTEFGATPADDGTVGNNDNLICPDNLSTDSADCSKSTVDKQHEWSRRSIGIRRPSFKRTVATIRKHLESSSTSFTCLTVKSLAASAVRFSPKERAYRA